jgi:hypothetical protein
MSRCDYSPMCFYHLVQEGKERWSPSNVKTSMLWGNRMDATVKQCLDEQAACDVVVERLLPLLAEEIDNHMPSLQALDTTDDNRGRVAKAVFSDWLRFYLLRRAARHARFASDTNGRIDWALTMYALMYLLLRTSHASVRHRLFTAA